VRWHDGALTEVAAQHQRDWNTTLPIFLLAYRASTHDTTGLTSANPVFRRELRLLCNLHFGVPFGVDNSYFMALDGRQIHGK
jgi:hypothetical protein